MPGSIPTTRRFRGERRYGGGRRGGQIAMVAIRSHSHYRIPTRGEEVKSIYWIRKVNELWVEWYRRLFISSLSRLIWVKSVGEVVGFEKKSRSCVAAALDPDAEWMMATAPAPLRDTEDWLSQPHIFAVGESFARWVQSCSFFIFFG